MPNDHTNLPAPPEAPQPDPDQRRRLLTRLASSVMLYGTGMLPLAACGGGGGSEASAETATSANGTGTTPVPAAHSASPAPAATPSPSPSPSPTAPSPSPAPAPAPSYGSTGRRPADSARLLGMNIGAKNYYEAAYQEALARLDIVVLGFYPGWRGDRAGEVIRQAVQAIKSHNPKVLVGQYTILNESANTTTSTEHAVIDKLNAENWWLRNAAGQLVQWTSQYGAYDINFTDYTRADSQGNRFPEWYAQWAHQHYFEPVPEFDFRYFDNVMQKPLVARADWKLTGTDQANTDPAVATAYRRGELATMRKARELAPAHKFQMANIENADDADYSGQWSAAFLEGLIGKSWSIETWAGWEAMMRRYKTVYDNLTGARVVGFNAWGAQGDYRALRYGLASALMGNGYYSHTLNELGYSTVPWFDEYEVPLGAAVDPWPTAAWQNGVWKRRYQKALVLVNPNADARTVDVGEGWQRFRGQQAPSINSGTPARSLTLGPKDGLILVPR